MTEAVEVSCSQHRNLSDCPDAVIAYSSQFDEYGLLVHDGGTSRILIAFCPWCGKHLGRSKRERWFEELRRRGIDPGEQSLPPEFESDEWWRKSS
jgi:hypothetical protein